MTYEVSTYEDKVRIDVYLDTHKWLEAKGKHLDDDNPLVKLWRSFPESDFEAFLAWLESEHGVQVAGLYGEGEPLSLDTGNEENCLKDDVQGVYFCLDGEVDDDFVSGDYLFVTSPRNCSGIWEELDECGFFWYNRAYLACKCGKSIGENSCGDCLEISTEGELTGCASSCGLKTEDLDVIEDLEVLRDEQRVREAEQRAMLAQLVIPGCEPTCESAPKKIILCDDQFYCPHCLCALEAGVW